MHLGDKTCKLNTLLQAAGLIFIFININLQLKLMNQDMLIGILIMTLRDKKHQKENNCVFIRINPDEKDFNISKEINKMHRHIRKSAKRLLIDNLSKRLLELEFKQNNAIK